MGARGTRGEKGTELDLGVCGMVDQLTDGSERGGNPQERESVGSLHSLGSTSLWYPPALVSFRYR